MFIVGLVIWWYGAGWKKFGQILIDKLIATEDFFSIDMLLGSIFAPFKQISASSGSNGTLQMKIQAWLDRQFSRLIGAIIRLLLIIVGAGWLLLQMTIDILLMILWPILPLLPIIGLVASIGGLLL